MNAVREIQEFLRLQLKGPQLVSDPDDDCAAIVTDDDSFLINCLIVANTPSISSDQVRALVSRIPRHEALRTAMILPDDASRSDVLSLRRDGIDAFSQVSTFTGYLDGHLRPDRVCADLLEGGEDAPNRSAGLLYEEDFIDPDAISQLNGKVDAITHLVKEWSHGHSPRVGVVLAPAGFGKSKLTHILAKRLARAYSDPEAVVPPPLPYLIPFGRFRGANSFDGLIGVAQSSIGTPLLTPGGFRYLVGRGRALLILDGYDEMLDRFPDAARSNLGEFISMAGPEARLILTARTLFYRSSGDVVGMVGDPNFTTEDVELLELEPFDRSKARQYLTRKLDRAGDRTRLVERSHELLDRAQGGFGIYGSPFFLSEFVELVRTSDKFSLSDVRSGSFLDYLVAASFKRERVRQGHQFTNVEQQAFLENMALDMLHSGSPSYSTEDLEVFALEAMASDSTLTEIDERVLSLLFSHHFLEPVDGQATFQHQVWRDYFQGKSLARAIRAVRDEAFAVMNLRDLPDGVVRNAISALQEREDDSWLGAIADRANDIGIRNLLRIVAESARDRATRVVVPDAIRRRLQGRNLSELYLTNLDFSGADLSGCYLTGSFLSSCDMSSVDWDKTLLSGTTFSNCEIDEGIAFAENASSTIDGEELFGPQLAQRFRSEEDAEDTLGYEGESPEDYVVRVMSGRMARFVRGGSLDTSVSWTGFMGGVPRADYDFVIKRLVRALKAEAIISEKPGVSGSRPPFLLSRSAPVRREVTDLVTDGQVGPLLQVVVDRLLKHRP